MFLHGRDCDFVYIPELSEKNCKHRLQSSTQGPFIPFSMWVWVFDAFPAEQKSVQLAAKHFSFHFLSELCFVFETLSLRSFRCLYFSCNSKNRSHTWAKLVLSQNHANGASRPFDKSPRALSYDMSPFIRIKARSEVEFLSSNILLSSEVPWCQAFLMKKSPGTIRS